MARRAVAMLLILNMLGIGAMPVAQAQLISTQTALQLEARQESLTRLDQLLVREEVQTQMLALGVNPSDVQKRLAALTDEELQLIEQNLDAMPAGGDLLAVIGILFIVLLILELVGAINIFSKA